MLLFVAEDILSFFKDLNFQNKKKGFNKDIFSKNKFSFQYI